MNRIDLLAVYLKEKAPTNLFLRLQVDEKTGNVILLAIVDLEGSAGCLLAYGNQNLNSSLRFEICIRRYDYDSIRDILRGFDQCPDYLRQETFVGRVRYLKKDVARYRKLRGHDLLVTQLICQVMGAIPFLHVKKKTGLEQQLILDKMYRWFAGFVKKKNHEMEAYDVKPKARW